MASQTTRTRSEQAMTTLALGVVSNRPTWLATCCWCLGIIYEPDEASGWQHVYQGSYLCARPLPGAPHQATASPLDAHDPGLHFRRVAAWWPAAGVARRARDEPAVAPAPDDR
jgi:hypothetical protein